MGSKRPKVVGFIGLGVMGEPICRHLARKSGAQVLAFDVDAAPLQRLAADGVQGRGSASAVMAQSDTVFLSLPSGAIVAQLWRQQDGLLASARPGHIVVEPGTSSGDGTGQASCVFS